MAILEKLTEGIVNRSLQKDGDALLNKWQSTGLLEGLGSDNARNTMAVLLENQAKELLREASSMAAGDVEGFAAVAFPIVRRVFGGLIANQLVSVQPMSLPSGLIFFLDFTFNKARSSQLADSSLYGGNRVASEITGGVNLDGTTLEGPGGFYDLGTGYSSPTGSLTLADGPASDVAIADFSDNEAGDAAATTGILAAPVAISALTDAQKKAIRFDPDVLGATSTKTVSSVVVRLSTTNMALINLRALMACELINTDDGTQLSGTVGGVVEVIRRLTHLGYRDSSGNIVADSFNQHLQFYTIGASNANNVQDASMTLKFPRADAFEQGNGLGSVSGADPWGLEGAGDGTSNAFNGTSVDEIPEIDIKVDSVAVTAITKKLKAKWTPELAQDLNAYHNLDAEVELTSILSEQIALEIDQEILGDLVQGATAGTFYWSRRPGRFIDRGTGADISTYSNESLLGADFTGTVSEWYETLIETINDISAQVHRKTLRGGANFLVCSPEAANILEFTAGFRASVTADVDTGNVGAVKVGAISKKFDIYVDPYFPRNVILVGRKGSSFLESGYVYAPYVPLQVTPTIFGVEDFVPRKGVMTRYAKKMVRPDLYGLVVIKDFLG